MLRDQCYKIIKIDIFNVRRGTIFFDLVTRERSDISDGLFSILSQI